MNYILFFLGTTLFNWGDISTTSVHYKVEDVVQQDSIAAIKTRIIGKHLVSLQWIGFWDYFGEVNITEGADGNLVVKGSQKGRGEQEGDYLTIDGTLEVIDYKNLKFSGEIVTRVSYINNGEPCVRKGNYTFRATGKRKYWRMKENLNPCDNTSSDYVDIFWKVMD